MPCDTCRNVVSLLLQRLIMQLFAFGNPPLLCLQLPGQTRFEVII